MGKGDWKRPIKDHEAFRSNWDRIFNGSKWQKETKKGDLSRAGQADLGDPQEADLNSQKPTSKP